MEHGKVYGIMFKIKTMATEKEIKVLKKIYDLSMAIKKHPYFAIHYNSLIDTIFSEEIIKRYRLLKVQRMAYTYLGRMARKDLIRAYYENSSFQGYTISSEGIKIIKVTLCSGSSTN